MLIRTIVFAITALFITGCGVQKKQRAPETESAVESTPPVKKARRKPVSRASPKIPSWDLLMTEKAEQRKTYSRSAGKSNTGARRAANSRYHSQRSRRMKMRYGTNASKKQSELHGFSRRPRKIWASIRFHTEEYNRIYESKFMNPRGNPLSTFSIDVDTASYSNVRRFIVNSKLPPKDAVRIEEFINYFDYDYPQPKDKHPFSTTIELSACPWNTAHNLVHIGLQAKDIEFENLPPCNLVFLIDISGSMDQPNKLPLVKKSLRLMVEKLRKKDKVSIVVYADAATVLLQATPGDDKSTILRAVDNLRAHGSTAGGEGIKLAYSTAKSNFMAGGNNRIVLATDGDFNVGISSDAGLVRLIEKKRDEGIFLTIFGFGMGNYKDAKMERVADKGNGNYMYIDNIREANKALVSEFGGTVLTVAKDVKIQVEFNPARVKGYRLIGYENRILTKEGFYDDTKDAGELGAGHSVTALYEVIPSTSREETPKTASLRYQKIIFSLQASRTGELMMMSIKYKAPDGKKSILIKRPVLDDPVPFEEVSDNFKFSTAVAEFGLLLRDSIFKGGATYEQVIQLAKESKGEDREGYRTEFIRLVETVELLEKSKKGFSVTK
jgi:Ca-activated chloride channel homolog